MGKHRIRCGGCGAEVEGIEALDEDVETLWVDVYRNFYCQTDVYVEHWVPMLYRRWFT